MSLSVLHVVTPAAAVGGLERVLRALAVGHRSRGHQVSVVAIVAGQGGRWADAQRKVVEDLREGGVHVLATELPARAYWRDRATVAAALKEARPDVVHTHGYRADVVDSGVAQGAGIPIVTTVHGFTAAGWRNRLYERLQLRALRRFDAVVAVSRPLGQRLLAAGVPRGSTHVIQNAYLPSTAPLERAEARRRLGLPTDGYLVGWVGRLSPEKGPDVFVDAVAASTGWTAVVVGTGPEGEHLLARANAAGASPRMRWLGTVPDMAPLVTAFDAIVLSSRSEGTPIVLFEAMAAGVPVVATAVGGVPDVVSSSEAVLVPTQDPAAIAGAIGGLRADPETARRRAEAARCRLASAFAPGPWLDRYEAVYAAVRDGRT